MGFGLLLLGYFVTFAFNLSKAYFFADVIGALIMLYAFTKLNEFNRYYQSAAIAGVVFTVLALANGISVSFHLLEADGLADTLLNVAKSAAALVMQVYMLLGIRGIAKGADCERLAERAMRNLVMVCFYYTMNLLVIVTSPLYPDMVSYVSFMVLLYWFVCFFFNLLLIHSSFGMFYHGDTDPMENNRSRFAVLNKMSDTIDKLDEKTKQYRLDSMNMALEEAEKKAAEKQKRKETGNGKRKRRKK